MFRRVSITACLVALFATIGSPSARTAPVGEPAPGEVDGPHEAVAWIRVPRLGFPENGPDGSYEPARRRYAQSLESPIIIVAVLRQPAIQDLETVRNEEADPMAWLVTALDVTAPEGTDLIRVGLRGERMEDLRQIVDAVVQTFVADAVEQQKLALLSRRDQLEKKHKEVQTEIRAKREARRALEKEGISRKPTDLAAHRKHLDELSEEIERMEWISKKIVSVLESPAADLSAPPKVQRVEAPKVIPQP